jgi:hypothetical protein
MLHSLYLPGLLFLLELFSNKEWDPLFSVTLRALCLHVELSMSGSDLPQHLGQFSPSVLREQVPEPGCVFPEKR